MIRLINVRLGLVLFALLAPGCGGGSPEQTTTPQEQSPTADQRSRTPAQDSPAVTGESRIEGFVFEDRNRNGIFDGNDVRMAQQMVVLTNPSATQHVQSATTDADGNFRLENLAAGEYRISVRIPEGYARTTDDSLPMTVSGGAAPPEVRFGLVRP